MRPSEERLLKLRVDSLTKSQFSMIGGLICIFFIFFYLIAALSIPQYVNQIAPADCRRLGEETRKGKFCDEFIFQTIPLFTTYVMEVDEFNQFLMVNIEAIKTYHDRVILSERRLALQIGLEEIRDDYLVSKTYFLANSTFNVKCDYANTADRTCGTYPLLFIPQLDPGSYKLTMIVENPIETSFLLSGLKLTAYTVNSNYYAYYLTIRYVFFIMSLVATMWYICKVAKIPSQLRVFEQNAIGYMLLTLTLFNDPFAYLNVILPSKFSIFVSVICCVLFISYILLFYMVLFENSQRKRVKEVNFTKDLENCLRFGRVGSNQVFFIFFTIGLCALGWMYQSNPALHLANYPKTYKVFFIFVCILLAITGLYILYFCYFILSRWRSRSQRNKAIFIFSLIFGIAIDILLYTSSFDSYTKNGSNILMSLAVCNVYVFLLAYLYSPTASTHKEIREILTAVEDRMELEKEYKDVQPAGQAELYAFPPENKDNEAAGSKDAHVDSQRPLSRPELQGPDDKPISRFGKKGSTEFTGRNPERKKTGVETSDQKDSDSFNF